MSCLQPRAAKQHGAQHRIVRLIQCGSLRSQHQVANCTGGRHELTTRGWLHWSCKNPVTVCLQLRRRLVVDGVGLAVGCFASNVGGQVSLVHQLAGVLTGGPCNVLNIMHVGDLIGKLALPLAELPQLLLLCLGKVHLLLGRQQLGLQARGALRVGLHRLRGAALPLLQLPLFRHGAGEGLPAGTHRLLVPRHCLLRPGQFCGLAVCSLRLGLRICHGRLCVLRHLTHRVTMLAQQSG
mmetsp:Transcript_12260/g.36847  ORF Transcript_12260/g.36847 Transcript_12260/m.36847 type:complete len:238 (-) Transcript_12260:1573-2286(-)